MNSSLEQISNSYYALIAISVLFFALICLLFFTNSKGFNKSFGYEIFITVPLLIFITFLIKEVYTFKLNPLNSWLSSFSQSKEKWFLPAYMMFIALISILTFVIVLFIGGIFSENPPENNTAMLINLMIILSFVAISGYIYKKSQEKDETILFSQTKAVRDLLDLRTKYTMLFVVFAFIVMIFYFLNPWGLMTNYGGPSLFFSLFVGMIIVTMIIIYQNKLSTNSFQNENPSPFAFIFKSIYILVSLGLSIALIYGALKIMGVFEEDKNWGHLIFNSLLFIAMLSVIYKLLNAGGFLDKNPYFSLLINTLFYIPCLFSSTFSFSSTKTTLQKPKPSEIKMLILSLILLLAYFSWNFFIKYFIVSTYLKQGGKQLINQPIQTDTLTNVSSYQSLTENDKKNYQHALSFWVYLDAFAPSRHNDMVNIVSYGDNPAVKYSSENNTMYITIKNDETDTQITIDNDDIEKKIEYVKSIFKDETDSHGNRILLKLPNIKLQKWNHILLNYNGGTLDIFYNGKLVKSSIKVVPYIHFDMLTVGSDQGVSGNVANLMYFDHPLNLFTIDTLYSSLKDKNPPVIPENKYKVIPTSQ